MGLVKLLDSCIYLALQLLQHCITFYITQTSSTINFLTAAKAVRHCQPPPLLKSPENQECNELS